MNPKVAAICPIQNRNIHFINSVFVSASYTRRGTSSFVPKGGTFTLTRFKLYFQHRLLSFRQFPYPLYQRVMNITGVILTVVITKR